MRRLAPAAILAAALVADGAGGHQLAFYLLLASIVVIAHAALEAYGSLVELPGSAPGIGVTRVSAALASIALVLALVAAAVRAPVLGAASVPAIGLSAVVAALAVLVLHGVLRVAR